MANVSAWQNMTGIQDLFTRPNLVTSGYWGWAIWGVAYVIMFIIFSSSAKDERVGFTVSSLIMCPVSFLMAILSTPIIPVYATVIPIVLTVIGVIITSKESGI
jgi:hypothetical protein